MAKFLPSKDVAQAMESAYRTSNAKRTASLVALQSVGPPGLTDATAAMQHAELRPDANSHYLPPPQSTINQEEVQKSLSERLLRYLGSYAFQLADRGENKLVVVITSQGLFTDEVSTTLHQRLNLVDADGTQVLEKLANELRDWIAQDAQGAAQLGLSGSGDGSVLIAPRQAKVVLTKLQ